MSLSLEHIHSPLRAAQLLNAGQLVAFPTETVFGLGVDATNLPAVERLFAVKGRPSNNPLIVHIASLNQLNRVASRVPQLALDLLRKFAPGPLTVVVPKHAAIVSPVTAGLPTVGVRIPNHAQALEMLANCQVPIAAPSANRSGKPSATTIQSVIEDFEGLIDGVLVSPPAAIGLESTVVDCLSWPPRVLRPGAIGLSQLQTIEPAFVMASGQPEVGDNSPGRLHPHYRPAARVHLFESLSEIEPSKQAACLAIERATGIDGWGWMRVFDSIEEYAAQFYECLREADRRGLAEIYCQRLSLGSGSTAHALMDRMERGAER